MSSQGLYELDMSSAEFPDRLHQLFHDTERVEYLRELPEDELAELINYLNDVLGQLDRTGQPFRKCFHTFQKICSLRGTLPASYQLSGDLSFTSEVPAAFGGFCDAYRGRLGTGMSVCIKKIRMCASDDVEKLKQSFCEEAVVWKHLSHPNIVPFMGVTLEPLQLVSEWMPGGELRSYLRENPRTDPVYLLLGIAEGLAYLHSSNLIHGDLKGPNIMVDGSGNAQITDFGLAAIARNPHSLRSTLDEGSHTARWCAPEILISDQPISKESDVFSFGMVIIEVFTGRAPFGEDKTPAVIAKVMNGRLPERPQHPGFTDRLWEITQHCLELTPAKRPDAEQLVRALKELPNQTVLTSLTPLGKSPEQGVVSVGPSTILSACIPVPSIRNTPKARVDGGIGVPPNKVDVQPSQTSTSEINYTSPINTPLPSKFTGSSLLKQRRNVGGIDSPDSGAGGKRHSTGQLGNGKFCASDNVQGSHTPRNSPVVQRSVENPRDPQHLDKWSKTSSGKVLLQWYDGENHKAVSIPIRPQAPDVMKKHGLWCRIKRFVCCAPRLGLPFSSMWFAV